MHENNLYAGGNFDSLAGIEGAHNIARWDEAVVSTHDGTSTLSNNFHIFPNPVKEVINIRLLNNALSNVAWELIDASGKTVYAQDYFSPTISVEHLSSGVYFLKISADENIESILLLKE